jgi:DNA mismatch endonuclease (patch repair protein)
MRVRKAAHAMGLRFRLHRKDLPGKPDITFAKHKTVVMVHGCFWHRHDGCPKASVPKTRTDYWLTKFSTNVQRDQAVIEELQKAGWRVAIIWECQTRDISLIRRRLGEIFGGGG